jgi:hypothetical protein
LLDSLPSAITRVFTVLSPEAKNERIYSKFYTDCTEQMKIRLNNYRYVKVVNKEIHIIYDSEDQVKKIFDYDKFENSENELHNFYSNIKKKVKFEEAEKLSTNYLSDLKEKKLYAFYLDTKKGIKLEKTEKIPTASPSELKEFLIKFFNTAKNYIENSEN